MNQRSPRIGDMIIRKISLREHVQYTWLDLKDNYTVWYMNSALVVLSCLLSGLMGRHPLITIVDMGIAQQTSITFIVSLISLGMGNLFHENW